LASWRRENNDLLQQIARLDKQVYELTQEGEYVKAIAISAQLCRIIKEKFGENDQDYIIALNNLVRLYLYIDDYAKAEPFFKEALEIIRSVQGENHPGYGYTLIGLLVVYFVTAKSIAKTLHAYLAAALIYMSNSDSVLSDLFYL
jgi:tetratricopeptide (TPR) repeat protein